MPCCQCRSLRAWASPVCVAPLYIMPVVKAGAEIIACGEPIVVEEGESGCVVEQTITVRVPVSVGAEVHLATPRAIIA